LANDLLATEKTAAALGENLAVTRAAAGAERARNEALALELAAREAEAKRREADLARVSAAEGAARARAESLAVDVGVARREKELLAAQTEALKTEVAAERAERQRVQAATTELAAGVGEMAERTGALTKEFREAMVANQARTLAPAVKTALAGVTPDRAHRRAAR
jgi:chromosome segregation ATPase